MTFPHAGPDGAGSYRFDSARRLFPQDRRESAPEVALGGEDGRYQVRYDWREMKTPWAPWLRQVTPVMREVQVNGPRVQLLP